MRPIPGRVSWRRWIGSAAALVLVATLIAACGSTSAAPTPKPKPSPTPCPVQAAAGVWVRGCVVLDSGDNLDLDGGQVNVSSYDLAYAGGVLTVAPGTLDAYLGVLDFGSITPTQISAANLGTQPLQVGQLAKGGVLAVRTGQGRPAKVRFDVVTNSTLDLSFVTYQANAPVTPSFTPTPTPSHSHSTPTPTPSSHPTASPTASPTSHT